MYRNMPHYKVTYYNIKGLGETVRYILAYMRIDFEDERHDFGKWPLQKNLSPFGKLPTLEIDGVVYSDSRAICRYLAHEAGLSGATPMENFHIDEIDGAVGDLCGEVGKFFKTEGPEAKEAAKQKIICEVIPFYMERFENILRKNNGYLANGKLSWIDLYLIAYSEMLTAVFDLDLEGKYPAFKALKELVHSQPGINEWIKNRPLTTW